ncbi:MAG: carboxypeptidase regulatory-like domain-containing protein [Deltaproteobacteria bacterium]|nr:carboxypeptidase regulatory-like domain-containing protein [Deltaproteobacteria bacterium]
MSRRSHWIVVLAVVALAGALATWLLLARTRTGSGDRRDDGIGTNGLQPVRTPDRGETAKAAPSRWALDPDPTGLLQLDGQVVDPDGNGIGSAVVRISSVPPRSTVTEGDGSFAFEELLARTYDLTASTATLTGMVRYRLSASADPAIIRVTEGASLSVTVVDADGRRPIAGASVKASETRGTTDTMGRVTVGPLRPGMVMVVAEAQGYAPETFTTPLDSAGSREELTIKLRKGLPVSGVVVDDTGAPIGGAVVDLIEEDWGVDVRPAREPRATDARGRFTLGALAPGRHRLLAVDGEHAPTRSSVVVTDRAVDGIVIVMAAGGRIAGRVVDRDKQPVPFATVKIAAIGRNGELDNHRQTTTDKGGVFAMQGLARTKLRVRAESDAAASRLIDIDLDADRIADLELVLDVAGTISGVVVDAAGRPVPEITVRARPDLLGGASFDVLAFVDTSSTTTGGGGTFELHALPEGAYWLWAGKSDAEAEDSIRTGAMARTGDTGVRLVLLARGGIRGTIVLDGASSPPWAMVQVGARPAVSTTNGAFSILDLAPGKYDGTVRGLDFAELPLRDIGVEPGKVTDLGQITVPRGRTLRGRVVDSTGAAVADATVKIGEKLWDTSHVSSATSDARGEFTVVGLADGVLAAIADHETLGRSPAQPIADARNPPPITLRLRRFGSISGTVTSRGKPVPQCQVSQTPLGVNVQVSFTETDDEGRFTMPTVPEGPHVLHAIEAQPMLSLISASTTVTVQAGTHIEVTIDLPVGAQSLSVEIRALPNHRVDGAQLFLLSGSATFQNGEELTHAFFQGSGRARKQWAAGAIATPAFENLVAGDYSVCVIPLTGSLRDPTFMERVQREYRALRVYCRAVRVSSAPNDQHMVIEVPSMTAFSAP